MTPEQELHKHECLARELLSWPLHKRGASLEKMETLHGSAFVDRLKVTMTEQQNLHRDRLKANRAAALRAAGVEANPLAQGSLSL